MNLMKCLGAQPSPSEPALSIISEAVRSIHASSYVIAGSCHVRGPSCSWYTDSGPVRGTCWNVFMRGWCKNRRQAEYRKEIGELYKESG